MDFIISLVIILVFVAASMKKSGQLDEIRIPSLELLVGQFQIKV